MNTSQRSKALGSEAVTRGVRVRVTPSYLPDHSNPDQRQYVFGYRVRVTNEGPDVVKLLSRAWTIVDAKGDRSEVEGEGVVGQQPELAPGESFDYASYCPIPTTWGTMEGSYTMEVRSGADEGQRFKAAIARFYLVMPEDRPQGARPR